MVRKNKSVLGKSLKNVYNTDLRSFSTITASSLQVTNLRADDIDFPFLSGNTIKNVNISDSSIESTSIGD